MYIHFLLQNRKNNNSHQNGLCEIVFHNFDSYLVRVPLLLLLLFSHSLTPFFSLSSNVLHILIHFLDPYVMLPFISPILHSASKLDEKQTYTYIHTYTYTCAINGFLSKEPLLIDNHLLFQCLFCKCYILCMHKEFVDKIEMKSTSLQQTKGLGKLLATTRQIIRIKCVCSGRRIGKEMVKCKGVRHRSCC